MTIQKLLFLLLTYHLSVHAENNSLTVYSSTDGVQISENQYHNPANLPGFAVIKETKNMDFKKGLFELQYDDVTAYIDPTSVSFSTPKNPDVAVLLDQNYRFDLLGTDSLLQRYLGRSITVSYDAGDTNQNITGRLLSTQGGLILKQNNGQIISLQSWQDIQFPQLPDGLLTKPTLLWLLDSKSNTAQQVTVHYQTKGLTWWADYVAELDRQQACHLNLSAWVSLVNQSGKNFSNYQLNLVAGDVNQAPPQQNQMYAMREEGGIRKLAGFQQESLFEYHKYSLPRNIDLPNNSTKQIRLIQRTSDIACEKELLFDAFENRGFSFPRPVTDQHFNSQKLSPAVSAKIMFENNQNNHLGQPLPAGRVRVNQADSQGTLTFIGADRIPHTANKQMVTLTLGNSFDVNGSRQQSDFKRNKNSITEQFKVTLSNGKTETETVTIKEHLYRWHQWHIIKSSHDYEKLDSQTIGFKVNVPAETDVEVTYTVEYQWPEQLNIND